VNYPFSSPDPDVVRQPADPIKFGFRTEASSIRGVVMTSAVGLRSAGIYIRMIMVLRLGSGGRATLSVAGIAATGEGRRPPKEQTPR
jgi:hypothetical protein